MALLNSIKTHQLDPLYFDQNRCEFRLDPKAYLSNWRLANLGAKVTQVGNGDASSTPAVLDSGNNGVKYPAHLGAYALIDRIRLFNDNVELASLRDVGDYLAFMNLGRTNANSVNMATYLNKSNFGFEAGFDRVDNNGNVIKRKNELTDTNVLAATDDTTPQAWLDLSLVLPLLKATPYILGTELRSLRLVIEWQDLSTVAQQNKFFRGTFSQDETVPERKTVFQIVQPTLIVDEMIDPSQVSKLKNSPISYINMDSEKVRVLKNTSNTNTQTVHQRLRAFDSRKVNRMLVVTKPTRSLANFDLCSFTSNAMRGEVFQFTLNGQKFLPYKGVDSPARKLALCNDVWGPRNIPSTANIYTINFPADVIEASRRTNLFKYETDERRLVGRLSYGGFKIGQEVDELLLDYERKPPTSEAADRVGVTGITLAAHALMTLPNHGLKSDAIYKITGVTATGGTTTENTAAAAAINDIEFKVFLDFQNADKIYLVKADDAVFVNTSATALPNISSFDTSSAKINPATAGTPITSVSNRASEECDLLFWGEVLKTMSVSDNKVTITYN